MSNNFKFEDFSDEVMAKIKKAAENWLEEAAGELESQVKRNTRVGGSDTKGNWKHTVDNQKLEATVGNPMENAIWEEFGTGEFALEGKGRKTAWYVPVEGYTGKKKPTFNGKVVIVYGKKGKQYYKTNGKKPTRALHNAFAIKKDKLIRLAQKKFKDLK